MSEMVVLIVRASLGFIVMYILTRILGRKEISQLTFADFISGITFGSLVGIIIFDTAIPLVSGVLVLSVWASWAALSNMVSMNSVPARKYLTGQPIVVIYHGQILEENLKHAYYTINDIMMLLREQSVFDPTEVEIAILEYDGKLSVLNAQQPQSETSPSLTSTQVQYSSFIGHEFILDGEIRYDNLLQAGFDEKWLRDQLTTQGILDPREVTIAYRTPKGDLYIDCRNDNTPNLQQED